MKYITAFDSKIMNCIRNNCTCSFMDITMATFSRMGNFGVIWLVSSLIAMTVQRFRPVAIAVMVSVVSAAVCSEIIIKPIVKRLRPYIKNLSLKLIINSPKGYSFPSGHTASSFAAAYVLMRVNVVLGLIALVISSIIGFSRIYLNVHYPTDVVAGVFLGIIVSHLALTFVL